MASQTSAAKAARAARQRNRAMRSALRALARTQNQLQSVAAGQNPTALREAQVAALRQLVEQGWLATVEPFLPLFFVLRGQPYTLKDHFPFAPLFFTQQPERLIVKAARQVGKTQGISAHAVLMANWIPEFTNLFVCPLYEQIRRLSGNYVRPLIDRSPVRSLWSGTATENSVLQRSFYNYSKLIFSFAFLDADRIRGISADKLSLDETQDLPTEHIPIIRETLSASKYKIEQYTGTPKTMDNAMQLLWDNSSQAEWWIPCLACNRWNIPSMEYHAEKMIGPVHDDISEAHPAILCYHCRRPVYARTGRWNHRRKELRWNFAGYHIPQIIMPMHYASRRAWADLYAKSTGARATSANVFWNEVMGESCDVGSKLISLSDLQRAACLEWQNNPDDPAAVLPRLKSYRGTVLGVDWGGGGDLEQSFTTLALVGLRTDGRLDVLWGKRLLTPNDHIREAGEIMHWVKRFRPDVLAHDFSGAGALRETIMHQGGKMPLNRMMPIALVGQQSLIRYVEPTLHQQRGHHRIDKTRSLLYTCTALRTGILRTFSDDHVNEDDPGLLRDFLALVQEKTESARAGDFYLIRRQQGRTDDFAHAVNFACIALWHRYNAWPDFYRASSPYLLSEAQLRAAGNADFGWETDPAAPDEEGFLRGP